MLNHQRRSRIGTTILATATLAISVTACADEDDDGTVNVPSTVTSTVVPTDPNDVSGGVPVDNLNPNVADTGSQQADDQDGDGDPEP